MADIARVTGQEFLLRGRWGGANLDAAPAPPPQQPAEYEEALPAWEQQGGAAAGAAAGGGVQYASVVAEGEAKYWSPTLVLVAVLCCVLGDS